MAYTTSKTDWTPADGYDNVNQNRVEANVAANRADFEAADNTLDAEKAGLADNNTFSGNNTYLSTNTFNNVVESTISFTASTPSTQEATLDGGIYAFVCTNTATQSNSIGNCLSATYISRTIGTKTTKELIHSEANSIGGTETSTSDVSDMFIPNGSKLIFEFSETPDAVGTSGSSTFRYIKA